MSKHPDEPKIYLLPNLMTAGNLCCGFFAILMIFKGMQAGSVGRDVYDFSLAYPFYQTAIYLIFGSCIFDLLDGRLARLGGQESPFGQEFDSIVDVVSFGVAPALLVSRAVLSGLNFEKVSWAIAFIYLLCGAMRLARFNCLANLPQDTQDKNHFRGIPIPMAAGFIASTTFLLIYFEKHERSIGYWNWALAGAMLGLAFLMISNVKYPSFKQIDLKTKGSFGGIMVGSLVLLLFFYEGTRWFMPTAVFSIYLLYGIVRHLEVKMMKVLRWREKPS